MLVRFTQAGPGDNAFWIEAKLIQRVTRVPGNPLLTFLVTTLQTPQGFQAIEVMEPLDTAAEIVNSGLSSGSEAPTSKSKLIS